MARKPSDKALSHEIMNLAYESAEHHNAAGDHKKGAQDFALATKLDKTAKGYKNIHDKQARK